MARKDIDGVSAEKLGLDYTKSGLGNMKDGEPLEYNNELIRAGRADPPTLLETIVHKANIAKAIVLIEGAKDALNKYAPEMQIIKEIDTFMKEYGYSDPEYNEKEDDSDLDDVKKTNLPPSKVKTEDSVATMPEENRIQANKREKARR